MKKTNRVALTASCIGLLCASAALLALSERSESPLDLARGDAELVEGSNRATAQTLEIRVGIIGTDTSHVTAFARLLNDKSDPNHVAGARVVTAFKGGSPDVDASELN